MPLIMLIVHCIQTEVICRSVNHNSWSAGRQSTFTPFQLTGKQPPLRYLFTYWKGQSCFCGSAHFGHSITIVTNGALQFSQRAAALYTWYTSQCIAAVPCKTRNIIYLTYV